MPPDLFTPEATSNIKEDLAAGQEPILLSDLPRQSWMPKRSGRALHVSSIFRWVHRPGARLEVIKTPGGLVSTKNACLRFFAALQQPDKQPPQPSRSPGRSKRDLQRARDELARAGF
jgi:hypothetical protein